MHNIEIYRDIYTSIIHMIPFNKESKRKNESSGKNQAISDDNSHFHSVVGGDFVKNIYSGVSKLNNPHCQSWFQLIQTTQHRH